jgi:hypothetical protein
MTSRFAPPHSKHQGARTRSSVAMPPTSVLLAAIPDEKLERLFHLAVLLGERPEWPAWAVSAVADAQVDMEFRAEFARLLERAWPHSRGAAFYALRHLAAHFNLREPEYIPPRASAPMRRRRPPPERCTGELEDAALIANKAVEP